MREYQHLVFEDRDTLDRHVVLHFTVDLHRLTVDFEQHSIFASHQHLIVFRSRACVTSATDVDRSVVLGFETEIRGGKNFKDIDVVASIVDKEVGLGALIDKGVQVLTCMVIKLVKVKIVRNSVKHDSL